MLFEIFALSFSLTVAAVVLPYCVIMLKRDYQNDKKRALYRAAVRVAQKRVWCDMQEELIRKGDAFDVRRAAYDSLFRYKYSTGE